MKTKVIDDCNKVCATLDEYEHTQVNSIEDTNIVFIKVAYKFDRPVGFIVVKKPKQEDLNSKISYCYIILATAQGERNNGYATYLVKEAKHWFEHSCFELLCWVCDKKNKASNELAKKCGFTFGLIKDSGKHLIDIDEVQEFDNVYYIKIHTANLHN